MTKFKKVDKKLIPKIKFESFNVIEFPVKNSIKGNYRVTNKDLADMPMSPDEAKKQLRMHLTSLFAENLEQNYAQLETKCDIKQDTFQKIIRERNGRGISRSMLAKFVVGAGVDLETADELFLLSGQGLDARNRFDYILMCALRDHDDIETFNQDLLTYGYPSIFSKPD